MDAETERVREKRERERALIKKASVIWKMTGTK